MFHCCVCCLKLRIEFLKHIITKTDKRSAQIHIMMKNKNNFQRIRARFDPYETYEHKVFAHIFTYIHVHTCFKRFTFWSDIIISKFYSSVPFLYLRLLNSFLLHLFWLYFFSSFFPSSFGSALRNAGVSLLLLYFFSSALFCVRTVTKALIKKMNEENTWKEWNKYEVHIAHTQMDMKWKWK